MQSGRIGADEVIDDTEGKGEEELEERLNENEAKTRAILLEMVSGRHQAAPRFHRAAMLRPSALRPGGRPARRRRPTSGERAVCLQTQPGHHRRGPGNHLLSLRNHQEVALSAQTLSLFVVVVASELRHCVLFPRVVRSCEIIRDWKSGDSLCYAFIEFDKVRVVPAHRRDHVVALLRFKLGAACNFAKSH